MKNSLDRFKGCFLGLALGDAMGAPHEGGFLERLLWRLIGKTADKKMRWTDDTQMSLDLADSLLEKSGLDLNHLASTFAASYKWTRGYGPGAAKLLKKIAQGEDWRQANQLIFKDGSYGNGGAMRAPVIGLFCSRNLSELEDCAMQSASITHSNPLALEGAVIIAKAVASALGMSTKSEASESSLLLELLELSKLEPYLFKLRLAIDWLENAESPIPKVVAGDLGNGMAATDSCVSAAYIAARFLNHNFLEMLSFVRKCGGDVDTIGAMAGAIWGAANGASSLPQACIAELEQADRIQSTAESLFNFVRKQAL